ncbi:MAG: SxtJ family membrane protein [Myxococcota bacterium]
MAKMVEMNLRPDARTLRQFGWIALAGFGLLALLAWKGWLVFGPLEAGTRETVAICLSALAGISTLFSLVYPKANLPIYVGLTVIAFPIGFVLSYVIMATLFYVVIAPIGAALRLVGKDPMDRRFLPAAKSYWLDARPERPRESYFKQF